MLDSIFPILNTVPRFYRRVDLQLISMKGRILRDAFGSTMFEEFCLPTPSALYSNHVLWQKIVQGKPWCFRKIVSILPRCSRALRMAVVAAFCRRERIEVLPYRCRVTELYSHLILLPDNKRAQRRCGVGPSDIHFPATSFSVPLSTLCVGYYFVRQVPIPSLC